MLIEISNFMLTCNKLKYRHLMKKFNSSCEWFTGDDKQIEQPEIVTPSISNGNPVSLIHFIFKTM